LIKQRKQLEGIIMIDTLEREKHQMEESKDEHEGG